MSATENVPTETRTDTSTNMYKNANNGSGGQLSPNTKRRIINDRKPSLDSPVGDVALNTNSRFIKLIAMIFMTIDHVGYQLMGNATYMRVLGRIAFPIYAWCVVLGCLYTHDIFGYMKRLTLFYFISQPCYVLAFGRSWSQHNIYLTLLLGLICLWALRDRQYWALPMTLLAAYFIHPNYGMDGVYIIILMYLVRRSKLAATLLLTAFCLYWGRSSSVLFSIGSFNFGLQSAALLALPLIIIPIPIDIRPNKYIFYIFYPAHLLIIYLIKLIMHIG